MRYEVTKLSLSVLIALLVAAASAQAVSFSVDWPTADRFDTFSWHEDTIYNPMIVPPLPEIRIPGQGGPGVEVDAFSYAHVAEAPPDLTKAFFSVDDGSPGVSPSALFTEPAHEKASDVYSSDMTGGNVQVWDGDGLNSAAPALGVPEPVSTNVDGLDTRYDPPSDILLWPGDPKELIFWSVDNGTTFTSPAYFGPGYTEADIFVGEATIGYSGAPSLYASRGELGLTFLDELDALVVVEDGVAGYNPMTDTVYFSLGRNSPTLALLGFNAGDILVTGGGEWPIRLFADHALLGLTNGGNLNALAFDPAPPIPEPATMSLLALAAAALIRKRRQR